MALVTSELTAEDQDQLHNPTLVSSTGLPFKYKDCPGLSTVRMNSG